MALCCEPNDDLAASARSHLRAHVDQDIRVRNEVDLEPRLRIEIFLLDLAIERRGGAKVGNRRSLDDHCRIRQLAQYDFVHLERRAHVDPSSTGGS